VDMVKGDFKTFSERGLSTENFEAIVELIN